VPNAASLTEAILGCPEEEGRRYVSTEVLVDAPRSAAAELGKR
jgi:hypothetical protein